MTHDVYIIGSGHTRFGRLQQTLEELVVEAARDAISEAGIAPSEIDAVFLGLLQRRGSYPMASHHP